MGQVHTGGGGGEEKSVTHQGVTETWVILCPIWHTSQDLASTFHSSKPLDLAIGNKECI